MESVAVDAERFIDGAKKLLELRIIAISSYIAQLYAIDRSCSWGETIVHEEK